MYRPLLNQPDSPQLPLADFAHASFDGTRVMELTTASTCTSCKVIQFAGKRKNVLDAREGASGGSRAGSVSDVAHKTGRVVGADGRREPGCDNRTKCLAELHEEACGDSDGVSERGPWREEGAPREEGRANVSLGPSWCCPPGVAVAEGVEEFASAVIWNVGRVAVAVSLVSPPSALLSQEARGVAAPWWASPPTKSAKVFGRVLHPRERSRSVESSAGRRKDRGMSRISSSRRRIWRLATFARRRCS